MSAPLSGAICEGRAALFYKNFKFPLKYFQIMPLKEVIV